MKRLLLAVIAALPLLLLAAVTPPAAAQPAYPNRPIRLILPTPAGGASDACARLVAQALSKTSRAQSWQLPQDEATRV